MFKNILLATDLSDTTRGTFAPLAVLARGKGTKVTLFHAVHGSSELFYLEGGENKLKGLIDEHERRRAMPILESYYNELLALGLDVEIVVRTGSAFSLILDMIRETNADLCAIGTRGFADFTGRMLASTTARVLRDADVPLLTVNDNYMKRVSPWIGFGKVLYPLDFSDSSMTGMHYAEDLAEQFGGSLEVVHVVAPIRDVVMPTIDGDLNLPKDLHYQVRVKLEARLSDAAHTIKKVPAAWKLIEDNKPGSGVMEYADTSEADLLVIPSIGRDSVRHTVLGSVTEHVIKHARCPVLTIRSTHGQ